MVASIDAPQLLQEFERRVSASVDALLIGFEDFDYVVWQDAVTELLTHDLRQLVIGRHRSAGFHLVAVAADAFGG